MTQKQNVRIVLISGLFFISLGGWFLHLRIHPPFEESQHLIPFISGIISVLAIPVLFFYTKTTQYAYVINGMLVIIGTITMAHFSLLNLPEVITPSNLILKTTLPDIILLFGKFAFGKAIFELDIMNTSSELKRKDRFFRYPNMGWWLLHLIAISIVYIVGNIFLRS
ncbi:MAG: hypothetical protein AABY84_03310 [Candidatus Firestonebacteria bacterium]